MGFVTKLTVVLVVVLAIVLYPWLMKTPPLPHIEDQWWSSTSPPATKDTSIKPFTIVSPPGLIEDLKARLSRVSGRLTPPLEGAAFTYGYNTNHLSQVLEHWRTKYDWQKQLKHLNKFPQFKTNIDGLDIHFIHVKPQVPSGTDHQVRPLMLLHGWPGSVVEFYQIIPMLTRPRLGHRVVFEVICPSLPGYGFSDAAQKPGLGTPEVANLMKKLMLRLGFDKFYLQGGDWGSIISSQMATLYPGHVAGLHINMPAASNLRSTLTWFLGALFPSTVHEDDGFFQKRLYPISEVVSTLLRETGYLHIQATKPDTVGVSLNDSPAGLAAYILEKFSSWTEMSHIYREDGGLTKKIPLDDMLNNVMIYWMTGTITSSMRLYAESIGPRVSAMKLDSIPCTVAIGLLYAPNELFLPSPAMLGGKFVKIVSTKQLEDGGHFLAMERPHDVAEHVFTTFDTVLEGEEREALERERNQKMEKEKATKEKKREQKKPKKR